MTPRIVVTGYASLDHVAMLDGMPSSGRTTTIVNRPKEGWPRMGGSPAYVAAALVRGGIDQAVPITWVGDDELGKVYAVHLEANSILGHGLAIVRGARTPIAVLAYVPDGGCICLYHPGMPAELALTAGQKALIAAADWACVTIGPKAVNEDALVSLGTKTRLAWVVKHDPRAMPLDIAARYALRADLICHSAAEADFVASAIQASGAARAGQIIIATQGASGATFQRAGETVFVPAKPLSVADPTGAGDSFAGGVLAALAKGESDPVAIVQAGHLAARALLETRRHEH